MNAQPLRNLVYYPGETASEIQAMATQPWTNVVLGQFHFSNTQGPTYGQLTWNDTPIDQITADVWSAVRSLPQIVSIQLGTAGNGTWAYIAANMDAAVTTLVGVITSTVYGIQGIDLDPEPIGAVPADVIYNFTLKLGAAQQTTPFYLSHVPVPWDTTYYPQLYGPAYWPGMAPYVDWITPQWYGSVGAGLVTSYEGFWSQGASGPTSGPSGPQPDILVGGQNSADTPLSSLTSAIATLNGHYGTNWGGIGLWAYPTPGPTGQWAQEISNALGPTSS